MIGSFRLTQIGEFQPTRIGVFRPTQSGEFHPTRTAANAFAAEFLAPASVLYAIGAKDAASIQSACMLSKEASSIREKLFQSIHDGYYLNATETRIVRRFDSFIHGVVA